MWIIRVTNGKYTQRGKSITYVGETVEYYGPWDSVHEARHEGGKWHSPYIVEIIKLKGN
jgi:hypothetical protein